VDTILLYLFRKQVTRFLYKKRKLLHRDISCNNILLRDVVRPAWPSTDNDLVAPVVPVNTSSAGKDPPALVPAKQSIPEELQEMCFASYLLRTKSNSRSVFSKFLPSAHFYIISPGRLDTGVLLIDFDMSEIQETGNQGDDKASHARMVR
jgi:hypothetical protein